MSEGFKPMSDRDMAPLVYKYLAKRLSDSDDPDEWFSQGEEQEAFEVHKGLDLDSLDGLARRMIGSRIPETMSDALLALEFIRFCLRRRGFRIHPSLRRRLGNIAKQIGEPQHKVFHCFRTLTEELVREVAQLAPPRLSGRRS